MALKRVVVTGLGALTPLGNSVREFWDGLKNGVSGCEIITHFDPANFKTRFACEIKNFDPQNFFDRKELRKLDPFAQFALVAVKQAFEDSQLNLDNVDSDRAGVIWGSGIGGILTMQQEVMNYFQNTINPRFSPFFIPKMISDIAAGHISMKYGFRGPNFTTVSACASSTHAIIDAMTYIRLGIADIFITGGSEASITPLGMGGFNAMQAISTNNDEYKSASRPFDGTRDGFVMGEGSGAFILEEYEHAKARGAKIYAELVGAGMSADAYHLTAPHPDGIGALNVMKSALRDANMKPEDIDYINTHGTATPLGDISEIVAIKEVFGEHAYKLNVSSTKSMTGHLLGASGAIEALASIMPLLENVIPPTINYTTPDERIDQKINYTFNKAQEREVNVALSNNFGFGGHNASVIFKKYTE